MKKKVMALLLAVCMIAGEEGMILQASETEVSQTEMSTELSGENVIPTNKSVENNNGVQEDLQSGNSADANLENQEENTDSSSESSNENQEESMQENSLKTGDEIHEGEAEQPDENIPIEGNGTNDAVDGKLEETKEKVKVEAQTVQEEAEIEQSESEQEEKVLSEPEGMMVQETLRGAESYYEQEPNNSISEANAISLGTTVYGSFTDNDREDYYKVTLPSAGALKLHFRSNNLAVVWVSIYFDESGKEGVFRDEWEWNENLKLLDVDSVTYLEPGTYFIKIYEEDYDYEPTGDYTCEVQFSSSGTNDGEPNNSFAEAKNLNMGDIITGQISCNDEFDYYKINVNAVGKVTMNITSYMRTCRITIYDGERNKIWDGHGDSEDTKGKQYRNEFYLESGVYYIRMGAKENTYSTYYYD